MKPLAIDMFCGLGGWTDGLLAEGWRVVGLDIERHVYGEHCYPAQLVLQDILTIHGSQFKNARLIVASPPCQEYSYMAMPWSLAKQKEREYLDGTRDVKDLTALLDADNRVGGPRFMNLRYSEHDALWHLVRSGQIFKDDLLMLLIRDAETDGAFLLQIERDSILHVINGGDLDVSISTGDGCVAADSHGGGESGLCDALHPVLEHGVSRGGV